MPPDDDNWRTLLLRGGRGAGKALDANTPIPTPSGWKKLADIAIGDAVFDEMGRTCQVTGVFDRIPERSYRVTFSDGTFLDACDEHQWVTWTIADRKALLRKKIGGKEIRTGALFPDDWADREPTTTAVLAETSHIDSVRNHCVPLAKALELPEADLPIEPYLLGCWLGDGTYNCGNITIGDKETELPRILTESGATLICLPSSEGRSGSSVYRVEGLTHDLCAAGLFIRERAIRGKQGKYRYTHNKHIPATYLRGSFAQRLSLLQGLMDTDGFVSSVGSVEFTTTTFALAEGVTELARSLGQKPVLHTGWATLNGRRISPKYRVTFSPTIDVFRLPRKSEKLKARWSASQRLRRHHRMIVSVEEIDPVPMRCLTVDSPHHMYLAGEGMIPTHNSWTASHIFAEWVTAEDAVGEWAIIAPSYRRLRRDCLESQDSGLLAALGGEHGGWIKPDGYNRGDGVIYLVTGAVIYTASSEDGARLIQGKNLKGAWCIARGELVVTARGEIPVEEVVPGDKVATRKGWREVRASRQTGWNVPVVEVETDDGKILRCTSNHRVFANGVWCEASRLVTGDKIVTCQTSQTVLPRGASTKANDSSTPTRWGVTKIRPASCSLRRSGAPITDPYRKGWRSTTATKIAPTTGLTISSSGIDSNTVATMLSRTATPNRRSGQQRHAQQFLKCGPSASQSLVFAKSAESPTRRVPQPRSTAPVNNVSLPVQIGRASVVRVSDSGSSDVFDLTIADTPEFFAGGILVHNCEELGLWENWEVAWDESLRYALRKGRSQVIATGTPKFGMPAAQLILRLLQDGPPTVVSRQLRTQDNAANLSDRMLEDVMKMAGTRLGRQELEGELIEDNPDALWSLRLIDRYRIVDDSESSALDKIPDLARVIVSVDPAVTSRKKTSMLIEEVFDEGGDRRPSDETGILVVGVGEDGHGYVLADLSGRYKPDEMARVVATAYHYWQADRVVVEVNNGGDFLPHVIATADASIPVRSVRATRGKFTRAEPVAACYSNGIVHHVGHFPDLEQEMCFFVPGKTNQKDDRVDALVWAITELKLVNEGLSWDGVWSAPKEPIETGEGRENNPWLKVYAPAEKRAPLPKGQRVL